MIVLRSARGLPLCPPASLPGITRVNAMNILGVALRDDLKAADHVDTILASSSRSLYALRGSDCLGPKGSQVLPSTFIHSFILAISIAPLQVLYYSEALRTTARILYRSFTPKRTGNCG